MAVSALWYGQAALKAFSKEIDFLSDTIKVSLHTATYTPNQDTHVYRSSLTNELATAGGYTAGGITLTTKTLTYTGGTNVIMFDADDASWPAATFTARYAVIYDNTPASDATRPLLGYVDFGADQSPAGVTFEVRWNASGILTITPA